MDLTVILDNTTRTLKENVAVKGKVIQELGGKLAASDQALELLRTQFKENTEKLARWEAIEPENLQIKCGELTTEVEGLKLKLDEADQKISTESEEKLLALAKLSEAELKLNAGEAYVPDEAVTKHLEIIASTEEKNRQLQETVNSQKKAIDEHAQKLEKMKQEFDKKKSESQLAVDKLLNTLEEKNLLVTAQLVSTEETVRVLEESIEIVNLEKKKSVEEKQILQEEITTLNQKNEESVAKLQETQIKIVQYNEDLATQLAELEEQKRVNSEFENRFATLHQQYEKLEDEFCKGKDGAANDNYQKLTKVLSEQQSTQWRDAFGQIEAENIKYCQKLTDIITRVEAKLGEQRDDSSEDDESIAYYKSIAQSACQLNQVLREEKESLFESLKARLATIDKLQTELFESQYKIGEATNRIEFLHERNKLALLEQSQEVQSEKNRADAFKGLYDEQVKENNVLKAKISATDEDIVLKISEINGFKGKNAFICTYQDIIIC
jgi:chromosome segregation ATPase